MASYLITGAGRGLGFAMVQSLLSQPAQRVSIIFATYRSPTEALTKLAASSEGRIIAVRMDVTTKNEIQKAVQHVEKTLAGRGLDVLINNAGILSVTPEGIKSMTDLSSTFETNVLGVHNVLQSFLPLLQQGSVKKIINLSTTIGCFAFQDYLLELKLPSYKITKAALNMLTLQWALELGPQGFIVAGLSPGYVKTDMCGEAADLHVEEAIPAIMNAIEGASIDNNGRLLDIELQGWEPKYAGGPQPW